MRSLTAVAVLLLFGLLLAFQSGCVDTPSQGQLPPDYHALARFIDAATDAGSGPVSVDGAQVATLNFADASSYYDFPAGGRKATFASLDQTISLRSQSQNTVVIYSLTSGNRFLVLDEGYNFTNNGKAGVASVRFVNAAQGSAPALAFVDSIPTGASLASGVGYVAVQPYTDVTPGNHTIYATSDGSYLMTVDGAQATPATASTTTGSGTATLSVSAGYAYSITMNTSVLDSFYTAAHFHYGPSGVSGSIALPIDVTGQTITFPQATISGSNAVPIDTPMNAAGSGSFTLTRDGLTFSIDLLVNGDTLNTAFTGGELRNAAAGANGPTVRTLLTGTTGDTTITGTWASTDAQPLSNALIRQLLDGKIYVEFHTNRLPLGGTLRAQLVPDEFTTTTYSGTWDTIPQAAIDSIVTGDFYVNFHTLRVPGGIVRGQVVVDPAGGQYGVASLPASAYNDGRMYTVVATGSGFSFALHLYSDRQAGLSKQSVSALPSPVKR